MKWYKFRDKKPKLGRHFLCIMKDGTVKLGYSRRASGDDEEYSDIYCIDGFDHKWEGLFSEVDADLVQYFAYISYKTLGPFQSFLVVKSPSLLSKDQSPLSPEEIEDIQSGNKWERQFKKLFEEGYLRPVENKEGAESDFPL